MMNEREELMYWRNVALNLLTDPQLDVELPTFAVTPRQVLIEAGFEPDLGTAKE
jgi:hypothetical protein